MSADRSPDIPAGPLDVTIEARIATLTLTRPDAANAFGLPLARALLATAIRCDEDPAIRCAVLTGNGRGGREDWPRDPRRG